ncbi:Chloride channel protein CLC-d [Glycine soja]|uniref:Chloride channel protein CLC-d n=1 Tax=Glycine soja TaxID=3848 RepID=A0A445KEW4_GLYSO|nr:Chloride channel protein CLC-d [Glycine soja]
MLPQNHSALTVAKLFLDLVVKIHGIPRSLVSDRDPLFISHLWQELFRSSGTHLRMSSANHPQSDGQTGVLNRVIEQYLRAFVHRKPTSWGRLLPWIEWSHNTSWMANTRTSPYEITFGRKPLSIPDYVTGSSKVAAVEDLLSEREATFQIIKKKLVKAQERMKHYADQHRRDIQYAIGDWVLVKLRPYRQTSAKAAHEVGGKLARRYYGPFKIIAKIDPVAYRLELPEGVRIHPVFHCSNLKLFRGNPESTTPPPLPPHFHENHPLISPLSILGSRRASSDPHSPWEVLVQWQGLSPDETSWENWQQLCRDYHLEDKVILQGPRDVTGIEAEGDYAHEEEETQGIAEVGKAGVQEALDLEFQNHIKLSVAFKLSKRKLDDNLHMLHTLLFGKKTKAHNLKRNIGQFSGYVWTENEDKQRAKIKEKFDKFVKEKLLDFCDVLNIQINKTNVKKENKNLCFSTSWRVFFTSAIVVRAAMGWCKSGKCGHFGSGGFIIWDISDGQEDYSFAELFPMAIIGVIGGLLGSLFNQLILYITTWRRNHLHKKGNRIK